MLREALVIGITQYDCATLENFTTPAKDARAIAKLLRTYGDFHVTELVSRRERITAAAVEEAIAKLFLPEGNPPDSALLYFSGHGLRKERGLRQEFLAASDTNLQNAYGVSLRDVQEILQGSGVNEKIVWLDCCYGGGLLEFRPIDIDQSGGRVCYITACRKFERAYAIAGAGHSLFTQALLDKLDPSQALGGKVYAEDLTKHVKAALQKNQVPICAIKGAGDLVLTQTDKPAPLPKAEPLHSSSAIPGQVLRHFISMPEHERSGRNTSPLHPAERFELGRKLSTMSPSQFEELVAALNPPDDVQSLIDGSQENKSRVLINWIEENKSWGVSDFRIAIDMISDDRATEIKQGRNISSHVRKTWKNRLLSIPGRVLASAALVATVLTTLTVPEIRHLLRFGNIGQEQSSKVTQGITYRSDEHQIEVRHPESWDLQRVDDSIDGTVLRLVPKGEAEEEIDARVIVTIEDTTGSLLSLEEDAKLILSIIKDNVANVEIISQRNRALSNRPGYEIVYVGEIGSRRIKAMRVSSLEKYRIYSLTYLSSYDEYSNYEDVANMIIDSFQLASN